MEKKKEKKENNFGNYIVWLLICSFYSIFKLFYESDGDISKYYRPFNEFFNHLIAIIVIGLVLSFIVKIFSKNIFSKILIWTTIVAGVMSVHGSIMFTV